MRGAISLSGTILRLPSRAFSSTAQRPETYGFIGLGQMGYQMARNLQSKLPVADTIRLYDLHEPSARRLQEEVGRSPAGAGVEVVRSVTEAASDADVVITVLPEPADVVSVFDTLRDARRGRGPGKGAAAFIDCSTIDPTTSRGVARGVESWAGPGRFVDAPMSGGVVGARAGTLTFMLGAADEMVARVEPVLLRMGRRVLHCGAQGNGLSAKLANNYLLAVQNIATAEAMNLGIRSGLDPGVLADVINVSTGRCWPSEVNNPVPGVVETAPAGRDYVGGFGIGLMAKDLRLAIAAAAEADARLVLAEQARKVYDEAEKLESCKNRDFSIVYRFLGGKG